jgi:hypothetical protein
MWFVISQYDDNGEYEILFTGPELDVRKFFNTLLANERNLTISDVRNVTESQFEIWTENHYQNNFEPGCAYTVKITSNIPENRKH